MFYLSILFNIYCDYSAYILIKINTSSLINKLYGRKQVIIYIFIHKPISKDNS